MTNKENQKSNELAKLLVSQKAVFNVEDLSIYTGLSKSAIYKLTSGKKLRFSCPSGKLLYFKKDDVDSFLLSNPVETLDDIHQEAINFISNRRFEGGKPW